MGSGYHGIARVEIDNGSIEFAEEWGQFSPDGVHHVSLGLSFTEHSESAGNIHREPVERNVEVWLTAKQLEELASQLVEWKEQHDKFKEDMKELGLPIEVGEQ